MPSNAEPQTLVVAALFHPLSIGTTFSRQAWPAHVTLASNFVVDESAERVGRAVHSVLVHYEPIPIVFEGDAKFGPNRDVTVQLVGSPQLHQLHEQLADTLEALTGWVPAEPNYWRSGYRPHMTHVPSASVHEGDTAELASIVVAALSGSMATVVSSVDLSDTPDAAH
jgi:2'-5' RNA ligase